ncbi:hypothetical protein D3C86_1779470 [compost metagenome]
MDFENLRRRKTAHQRLTDLGRVGPVFRSEQQGFGHRLDVQGDDDLVRHFGGLTVAIATDPRDVLAHALQQRQGAVEHGLIAADHDAQGASLGTDLAAGDRCIQVTRAGGDDFFRERLGG